MKQEWFESKDFVKTTSKSKPDEQSQDVADKAEETIVDLDTPIEKNTQVEEDVSQAEIELENQQGEKIETPENGEARIEIEEKKALDSTEEEQDLSKATEKVTIAEESQEALPQQKTSTKEPLLISQSLESPYIPDQAPKSTDKWKEQALDFWSWLMEAIKSPTSNLETSSTHSYTAFLLLILFSASSFFFSIYHIKQAYYGHIATINSHFPEQLAPLGLFSIISILVATTLFLFSFLLGSFVVKRFIHQETDWTLEKVFQQYSQLLAIPIFLTAIASFFAFFDSLRFTALLCVISIGIILLASLHIITRPSQASETDSFYQLFLSVLVNGVIILLFFVAEVALIGDYLRILAFL
ncbi:membrane protein [Streptococcus mitis 18/56]|uniref:Membrane protein n=1 Tax=Streptococcus mitis 18/56 TaxID=1340485 RepID=S7XKN0_STRMT|nr:membrane protein [Streptococcus mitis 18/56]